MLYLCWLWNKWVMFWVRTFLQADLQRVFYSSVSSLDLLPCQGFYILFLMSELCWVFLQPNQDFVHLTLLFTSIPWEIFCFHCYFLTDLCPSWVGLNGWSHCLSAWRLLVSGLERTILNTEGCRVTRGLWDIEPKLCLPPRVTIKDCTALFEEVASPSPSPSPNRWGRGWARMPFVTFVVCRVLLSVIWQIDNCSTIRNWLWSLLMENLFFLLKIWFKTCQQC